MSHAPHNGQQPVEHPDEARKAQKEAELQRQGIQHARERAEEIHSDLLEQITDSDLHSDSRQLLENLVSKDFIFANLTDPEVESFKRELDLKRKAFYVMHPSQESVVEGTFRAYVYDDPGNTLTSLSQQEKLIVDQFFEGIYMRVTRARGMRQQEILKTQINQSVTGSLDTDNDSGGLLQRWRS